MGKKEVWSNLGISRLNAPLAAAGDSLTLKPGDGQLFPALTQGQFFRLCIRDAGLSEIVIVNGRAGDVLTGLERAQEGTAARDWPEGSDVLNTVTAGAMAVLAKKKGGGGYNPGGF